MTQDEPEDHTMDDAGTGNWSENSSGPPAIAWDPSVPVYCYTANEYNTKFYLVPIYQIISPILLTLCALSVIGNTLILLTVFYMRKKHLTPTLMFSLSLAGADAVAAMSMGLGFLVNNILLIFFDINVAYKDCIVLVLEAFRLAAMVGSALHFVVLAVNHWMGITKPLHYASRMTRRKAVGCIVLMWILPVVVFLAYFSLVPDQGFQSPKCQVVDFAHRFAFRSFVSALFFIPMTLMSIVYLHVFYEIQRHQKKLCSLDVASNSDEKRRMQSNTKALITTLIILLTYLIGWLPAVVNYVIVCDDCIVPLTISLCIRLPVNIVTNLLIVLKFLIDPVIYTARIQEVRNVIKHFLARWGCRKQDTPHRAFDRFDSSSRAGSLMTSLRYSTYRQRKESDSSAILQRVASTSTQRGANGTPAHRRPPQLLTVHHGGQSAAGSNGNNSSVIRRTSTGSSHSLSVPNGIVNGESNKEMNGGARRSLSVAPLAYPAHSPLIEVSETFPVTPSPSGSTEDSGLNGTVVRRSSNGDVNGGMSGRIF